MKLNLELFSRKKFANLVFGSVFEVGERREFF